MQDGSHAQLVSRAAVCMLSAGELTDTEPKNKLYTWVKIEPRPLPESGSSAATVESITREKITVETKRNKNVCLVGTIDFILLSPIGFVRLIDRYGCL